jgi:hypothetical protein
VSTSFRLYLVSTTTRRYIGARTLTLSLQVANTLRRLFTEGDIDLCTHPLYCFSLQVGREQAIIHPIARY